MPAAAVPKLYNQLRLESFEWIYDPASSAPTGVLNMRTVAWSTEGPVFAQATDLTLGPDDDPSSAITSAKSAQDSSLVGAGFTLALDPAGYNP